MFYDPGNGAAGKWLEKVGVPNVITPTPHTYQPLRSQMMMLCNMKEDASDPGIWIDDIKHGCLSEGTRRKTKNIVLCNIEKGSWMVSYYGKETEDQTCIAILPANTHMPVRVLMGKDYG